MAFSVAGITGGAADLGGAAQDLFFNSAAYKSQAKGSRLQAQGLSLAAQNFRAAVPVYNQQADTFEKAAGLTADTGALLRASTAIQKFQAERGTFKAIGTSRSDAAGQGLAESGSALDIIRDSAMQASLTTAMIDTQGAIDQKGIQIQSDNYMMQAENARLQAAQAQRQAEITDTNVEAALEQAKTSEKLAKGSQISGVFKGISGFAKLGMMFF